ncbi:SDR family NAD(P)-dependent oxidoreductase [Pseudomonas abieticivorans]|uniref:SDR family NAD(P)-dependent oxidoreductase n=1 Tax=Pseudomonas abieticivorans TaxID=2931382 RepID=UPI0020BEEE96|nr:SDR family oxidoreductase [Pseudomonas sp. PIA16]
MRKSLLIVGGGSDMASYVRERLSQRYDITAPSRSELDITSRSALEAFFETRSFDIVLNCAGTLYECEFLASDPEQWVNDISVNLIGTYLLARAALLKNNDARLCLLSSTAAFNAYTNWSSYCVSKAGVVKLHATLHKSGFDVVTLCPGAIDTKFRHGTGVVNPNVMSIEEGCRPVLDAIEGGYQKGDIVFYRKNDVQLNPDFAVDKAE